MSLVFFNIRCQQSKSVKLIAAHLNEWDSKLLLQKLVKILESAVG